MKRFVFAVTAIAASTLQPALAQVRGDLFGNSPSPSAEPESGSDEVEITADGKQGVEGRVAYAEDNVTIRSKDTLIRCDRAEYNADTKDVYLEGNVQLFTDKQTLSAERGLYNLETKAFSAAIIRGDTAPFRFGAQGLVKTGEKSFEATGAIFTTSDSSKPDYHLRARTVRIYPDDRVVMRDVTLYVGQTPVFWFPFIHQNLKKEQGFTIEPGYNSVWGPHLLGTYAFPLAEEVAGRARFDWLGDRGIAAGLEADWEAGKEIPITRPGESSSEADEADSGQPRKTFGMKRDWGRFRSYYLEDSNPDRNRTALAREGIDTGRYRISFQARAHLADDLYASIDINKLSDGRFLQDFEPGEFRRNPNPDNVVSLTKWDESYTASLTARKNLNEKSFDGTERLPEAAIETSRIPLGKSGFYYQGETSAGLYRRNFFGLDNSQEFPDYDTLRADSYHQLFYPASIGSWLNLVPRVAVRGTYYQDSGFIDTLTRLETRTRTVTDPVTGQETTETYDVTVTDHPLVDGGSTFRPAFHAGLEGSFKISRAFEDVQKRSWGLDGLRHVVQPYFNLSYNYVGEDPDQILQFDRVNRFTRPPGIDYPAFNTVDSLDNWSILRLGVFNRLQTRRDNQTVNWLELNTWIDVNFDRPDYGLLNRGDMAIPELADTGTFSNLYNRLRWTPVPWVSLNVDSQIPLFDGGFTELNSSLNLLLNENLSVNLGHRYISSYPTIDDSSLLVFGGYLRLGENWSVSFRDTYELTDGVLETQRYELHRDLSSWIASLGLVIRDNSGTSRSVTDYGMVFTLTLKDLPNVKLPLNLDPDGFGGGNKSR